MSYTSSVKEEIFASEMISSIEKKAELSAILLSKNALLKDKIELRVENIALAKRVYSFIKSETTLKTEVKYLVSKKLGEHNVYIIVVPRQRGYREFVELIKSFEKNIILASEEILKGFVRGVFLACGYIKDPKKEYALDFFMDSDKMGERIYEILLEKGKKVFMTIKRNKPLIYLRNSEDIMDILVMVGAIHSFFKFEETTMIKDLKNKTIREMNWEVANETKSLNTGIAQVKMIRAIEKELGLETLSPVLEEIAKVRLENPESTLLEIANIVGISKSGVRNRFRRIEEVYKNLEKEEIEE